MAQLVERWAYDRPHPVKVAGSCRSVARIFAPDRDDLLRLVARYGSFNVMRRTSALRMRQLLNKVLDLPFCGNLGVLLNSTESSGSLTY